MQSILIIGGTGLLGRHIAAKLCSKYEIRIMTRKIIPNTDAVKYYKWNPDKEEIDLAALSADIIINLAGEGIADSRWTADRKKALIDSRVKPAAFIARTLRQHNIRPKLYIGASAIGIYGDRGDEALVESSGYGEGFMVDCCKQWETASVEMLPLVDRLLVLRIGIVLTNKGGALPKLMMTSPLGVLNYFGNGGMYYSWIHIDDIVGIIESAIEEVQYIGVINAVAPKAVSNKKFMQVMAESMPWPKLVLPAPLFAIKLALGEMAAVVLNSNNVVPAKLRDLKYNYRFPALLEALQDLQKRKV